ncbi:hypothetical protein E3N88_13210 [Mikania micrantha]|uniref:non-specific serine/threonine protein kinase n=1 Tax=Mikania micrantha TaxID=192012 RepID=A0A5N6P7Q5_9ASTR|nr:hypothetical protein E3N88_13210 [Mikania micrantha]
MSLVFIFVSSGNETDHEALMKIRSMITQDPYGVLNSWNNSLHFCNWTGVTCGKRHKRVTYLRLNSGGLEGSLSPHVGNLSFLRGLFLYNNSFQGTIPDEIGRLFRLRRLALKLNKFNGVIPANISSGCSNLEWLDLSYNELVGSIPKETSFLFKLTYHSGLSILQLGHNTIHGAIPTNISGCSNLQSLDLSNNKLVGRIPEEISYLSKLANIALGDNSLTGGIPSFMGNITSMEKLIISRNPLGGSIPDTVGHWKNLSLFSCSNCNLSGTIPHSLFNLSLLVNLSLDDNQLKGSLPTAMMLPNLLFLQLSVNKLTGSLPPSISNCSKLRYLQMAVNKFSGRLTINFAKLRDITFINLGQNNFGSNEVDEMKFFDSLENCTKLKLLDLHACNFQVLPVSLGNLSNQLKFLYLNGNQFHGNLPESIGSLSGLELLSLSSNQFTGNIPSTIGSLQILKVLYLYNNQLSGHIPDVIGNLSLLISLHLFSNKLEGVIPSSLGNCHNLLALYLYDNKLNGKIPTKLLQLSNLAVDLNLSQNNLFGSLPTEVGDLKMLTTMDLSENNLSGSLPSSLGGCASLLVLSLRSNSFQGMIPSSLSSLKGLMNLDISHNNLSGQIPNFLQDFKLEYLDMSYNDFEGEVPMLGVFSNASAFSILGNSRLCGGIIELGLPRCKETHKHRRTHKFPLIVILLILIVFAFFTIIFLVYAWRKNKRKRGVSRSSTSNRFLKVSYNQILKATNGFSESNLIGNGGFSSVYKGILDGYDNRVVAIKVLHLQNQGAQRSFTRECEALRSIRHRNLLRIITSCSSIDFQGNDFKALVYEFMPNGSLHDWLHSTEATFTLNFIQITSILVDVACALDYLHNHCLPTVVHGDLNPRNILIDADMVAHVGDFGLTRFLGTTLNQNSSTDHIRGTTGYAAPEYGLGSDITCKGDVYSFGIVLLEVITRKKPTDNIFNEGLNLHKFVSNALPHHLTDVISNAYQEDETAMQNQETHAQIRDKWLASILKIGVSCSMDSPQHRMDMKNVVDELKHILDNVKNV